MAGSGFHEDRRDSPWRGRGGGGHRERSSWNQRGSKFRKRSSGGRGSRNYQSTPVFHGGRSNEELRSYFKVSFVEDPWAELAARGSPNAGDYFKVSFLENPWADLEQELRRE
mmetsp:Transcript_9624/g.41409  ORF Transcript_9624/g.41409 Transcript_9624/m.41409 type:complete len:112 (-) Transcript_9624:963-1298(-)